MADFVGLLFFFGKFMKKWCDRMFMLFFYRNISFPSSIVLDYLSIENGLTLLIMPNGKKHVSVTRRSQSRTTPYFISPMYKNKN